MDRKDCSKTIIRFTTNYINTIFPTTKDHSFGWKNGKSFMYEMYISENYKCACTGVISNTKNSKCIDLYHLVQKDNKKYGVVKRSDPDPNNWARAFRSKTILEKEQTQEGLSEIEDILNKNLANLFEKEIPMFEKALQENL